MNQRRLLILRALTPEATLKTTCRYLQETSHDFRNQQIQDSQPISYTILCNGAPIILGWQQKGATFLDSGAQCDCSCLHRVLEIHTAVSRISSPFFSLSTACYPLALSVMLAVVDLPSLKYDKFHVRHQTKALEFLPPVTP